ncbi:MFS transporter [Fusibacter ferrireducens]|uniref:MFS transporter n=1 Tax=Fusibacter ferrireducens TaxID=2785058 RepID=A0ABR9ZXT5_9FIRM|nr:MFS transporter [Fusibacter ferrireducens]MBF4694680.1 MFS transporter [Fusibacter ferrireducens]
MNQFIKSNSSLIAVSWGHFVNDFFMSVVPITLFAFAEVLKLNATQMSVILFVITTAGTFFQPLVGLLIDRVQRSVLLILALIWITVGMSLSGIITNFYLLTIVVGLAALGSSVYHPLGSTITIHKTGLSKGKSLSIFMTVGSFAHTAAPLVAIPLVSIYGLNALAYLLIPGLLSALFLYLSKVHQVKWTREVKQERSNSEVEKKELLKNQKEKMLSTKQQLFMSIPVTIAVVKGVLYRITIVFGVIIMGLKGVDHVQAGFVLSGFMLARAIATLVGGFVSDSIGEEKTLKIFNLLSLISVFCFLNFEGVLMIIGLVILGFSINATSAANITIMHKIIPDRINFGTGIIMGFSATLSAVVMLGYGVLVDLYGHVALFNLVIGLTGLMALVSFILPKSLEPQDLNPFLSKTNI